MNTETIQSIFSIVVNGVEPEWKSIEFKYKVDETQSEYYGSYKTDTNDGFFKPKKLSRKEKTELSELLRSLRNEVLEIGKEPFTHCTLSFTSEGGFNIEYSYDPIDWSVKAG